MPTERTVLVRLKADVSDFVAGMRQANAAIDKTNDRVAWMTQGFLALAPAMVPLGAAVVPVLSGLAAQATMAAGAAGTMGLAFVGVGDALEKLNKYQLDPSDTNLKNMALAMQKIGPAGEEFVRFLDMLGPKLGELQTMARQGMFPGAEEGITSLLALLPTARRMVAGFSLAVGDLMAEAGQNLAGPKFEGFFDYIETEMRPMLIEMGHTMGNFVDGFAAMLTAFAPLSRQFSHGFEQMSKDFAIWAHGLEGSDSFASFVEYVQQSVPKALEFLGAMSDAFVDIVKAAAPVGEWMLPMLEQLLDIIAGFARTPLGPYFITAMAFMSAWGRLVALATVSTGKFTSSLAFAGLKSKEFSNALERVNGQLTLNMEKTNGTAALVRSLAGAAVKTAGAIGIMAVAMSDLDDKAGLTNTTMLALSGLLMGGPVGLGIGAAVGLILDARTATGDLNDALDNLRRDSKEPITTTLGFDRLGNDIDAARLKYVKLQDTIRSYEKGATPRQNEFFLYDVFTKAIPYIVSNPIDYITGLKNDFSPGKSDLEKSRAEIEKNQKLYDHLANTTLKNLKLSAEDAAWAQLQLANGMHEADVAAALQAKALEAARAEAKKTADEFLKFGDDLDDKKVGLNAWITGLEDAAKALENFRKNAIAARENGLRKGLVNDLLAAGPEGALRLQQLAGASQSQIERANRAFEEQRRQRKLFVDKFGGKLPDAQTDVKVRGIDEAIAKMNLLREALGLPKVSVLNPPRWLLNPNPGRPGEGLDFARSAEGGTVPTTGLGYADRHPYLLADGEEVISNRHGQADRHRELLKAINANRLADGGTARRWATAASAPVSGAAGLSTAELSAVIMQAVKAQRPVYGDVTVVAHSYDDFVREQKQDMARVGGGGLRR